MEQRNDSARSEAVSVAKAATDASESFIELKGLIKTLTEESKTRHLEPGEKLTEERKWKRDFQDLQVLKNHLIFVIQSRRVDVIMLGPAAVRKTR